MFSVCIDNVVSSQDEKETAGKHLKIPWWEKANCPWSADPIKTAPWPTSWEIRGHHRTVAGKFCTSIKDHLIHQTGLTMRKTSVHGYKTPMWVFIGGLSADSLRLATCISLLWLFSLRCSSARDTLAVIAVFYGIRVTCQEGRRARPPLSTELHWGKKKKVPFKDHFVYILEQSPRGRARTHGGGEKAQLSLALGESRGSNRSSGRSWQGVTLLPVSLCGYSGRPDSFQPLQLNATGNSGG